MKNLAAVLMTSVLLGISSVSSADSGLESIQIGDRMPLLKNFEGSPMNLNSWKDISKQAGGVLISIDVTGDLVPDFAFFYLNCENDVVNLSFPFLVYDLINKKFYLDNNVVRSLDGNPTDGFVDKISDVEFQSRNFGFYAPPCSFYSPRYDI